MATILMVEDEADIRDLVRAILEMDGHEVVEAATGDEGVERALEIKPDIILMDVSLSGAYDGLEATRRLRTERAFDSVPIIALTAHAMSGDRERAIAAGCDEHWTKPISDLMSFRESIGRAIAQGRRL